MRFSLENKELAFCLSHREAGMRLRRSTICCSSVLLSVVYASSASAWSIAGLLWTVVELCSSVGCFHTPSTIRFSTMDPLSCTKTILSRYDRKQTALKFLNSSHFMKWPLLSALIHIFCLCLYMCTAEAFLEFCSLCTDHYRCRDLLRKVTGTELLSDTWSSDQGGSFCGGAWQNAWSTPCTCTPSSLMRPTWKCCLPGLWVSLGLYEFLMFGVNYSTVLSSTHKNSISVVITGLLFDLSVILSLLLSFRTTDWKMSIFCHRRSRSGPRSVLLREVSGFVWSSVHVGYYGQSPSSQTSSLRQHYARFHRDVEVSSCRHGYSIVLILLRFFNITVSGKRSVLFILEEEVNVRSSAHRALAT